MTSSCRWLPGSRSARWLITVIAATSNTTTIAIEATAIAGTSLRSMAMVITDINRAKAIARVATTNVRVTATARVVTTSGHVTATARVVTINPGASTERGGRR